MSSYADIPLSYASVSIGCKSEHTLPKKIEAIAAAAFQAMELGFPDLLAFAQQSQSPTVKADDYDSLVKAAQEVKSLCEAKGLKILLLQPLPNFEGWPVGSTERQDAWSRVRGYMRIMEAAGTDTVQVGSTDIAEDRLDRSRIVPDLCELADLMATKNFRVSYENWAWSTHAPDWQDIWVCTTASNSRNNNRH